ncbi:hypothetical protein [Sinorhizobium fredii]|uniref:hypothetical protein n=1 Tax=Rhizobium fredii TaxID=380 RepID=UPI000CF2F9D1|nr:hypothetical protein [Sinorhizobium fredii]
MATRMQLTKPADRLKSAKSEEVLSPLKEIGNEQLGAEVHGSEVGHCRRANVGGVPEAFRQSDAADVPLRDGHNLAAEQIARPARFGQTSTQ